VLLVSELGIVCAVLCYFGNVLTSVQNVDSLEIAITSFSMTLRSSGSVLYVSSWHTFFINTSVISNVLHTALAWPVG